MDMVQGTAAWFEARLGKVTASRVKDVCARLKSGKPAAARDAYMGQLIAERLTGQVADSYVNAAMRWGTEHEPEARTAYEFWTGSDVAHIGFAPHPRFTNAGASPDGLVGTDGTLEIKCPQTTTHVETLLGQSVPDEYLPQIQWQLACTGRSWCDFVSWDPRLPEEMRLFVRRVARDDAAIAAIEAEVATFLEEIDAKLSALAQLFQLAQAA